MKDKLENVIKEWEKKGEDLFKEASLARKSNYQLDATLLDEKYKLIRDFCLDVRLQVIEQLTCKHEPASSKGRYTYCKHCNKTLQLKP